ncbi:MAG: Glycine oxidase [Elusimicrobia bacterium]|nr:Glycine oxidase [Elusimicrobiota bacterium]
MKENVVVLGGGIIGALAAYEIAKGGATVTLLEKYKVGHGASGNSAAMLELQLDAHRGEPFLSLARASHDLFPVISAELRAQTGIDIQFSRCSILQVALDREEAHSLKNECDRQSARGLEATWISPSQVNQQLPGFTPHQLGGALYTQDGQVHGGLFLEAALQAARQHGVSVQENVSEEIIQQALLSQSKIVVAAGAWTDQLLKPLGIRLGVSPVRGQLMVFSTPHPVLPFPVYTKTGGYLVPKADGTTLAGTTVEQVGFDSSVTPEGQEHITTVVKTLMPSLMDYPLKAMTAGLRPQSPDDLPLLGPLPDHPNIFVAAGHYRNGILLAPITAKILAAWVKGDHFPVQLDSFLPSRVSLRA